ncbi:UNVERIFIED_CONTAM: hypothetical protein NCL1_36488 [Trichonephila clavipes]
MTKDDVSTQLATPAPHGDESRFNLRDHGGRIRNRRYAVERCLPECVIERHSGLTPGVIVWNAISYPGRFYLLFLQNKNIISTLKKSLKKKYESDKVK